MTLPSCSARAEVAEKCVHCNKLQYSEFRSSGGQLAISALTEAPSVTQGGRITTSLSRSTANLRSCSSRSIDTNFRFLEHCIALPYRRRASLSNARAV